MDFVELAKKRYSCKKFDGRPISQEQLDVILAAAQAAPTAKNLQEQKIYILTKEEDFSLIAECTPCRYNAGTVAIVAFNKNNVFTYPGGKRNSGVEDATIVATHMILAAASVGVDSCWINNFDPDKLKKVLNLSEEEEILMMLDLGYAAEGMKPLPNHTSRKSLEETVVYR